MSCSRGPAGPWRGLQSEACGPTHLSSVPGQDDHPAPLLNIPEWQPSAWPTGAAANGCSPVLKASWKHERGLIKQQLTYMECHNWGNLKTGYNMDWVIWVNYDGAGRRSMEASLLHCTHSMQNTHRWRTENTCKHANKQIAITHMCCWLTCTDRQLASPAETGLCSRAYVVLPYCVVNPLKQRRWREVQMRPELLREKGHIDRLTFLDRGSDCRQPWEPGNCSG